MSREGGEEGKEKRMREGKHATCKRHLKRTLYINYSRKKEEREKKLIVTKTNKEMKTRGAKLEGQN